MKVIFAFLLSCAIYAYSLDKKTEQRLSSIEQRIENIEKKLEGRSLSDSVSDEPAYPDTTGNEIVLKSDLLKAKIISKKKLDGKKKKGLLLEVSIYNSADFPIKIFTADILFYLPDGRLFYKHKAYDDNELGSKKKKTYPVLITPDTPETYFYFLKYEQLKTKITNQKLIVDAQTSNS